MKAAAQSAVSSYGDIDPDILLASLEATAEGLMLLAGDRIVFANPAAARMLGVAPAASLTGQSARSYFAPPQLGQNPLDQAPANDHEICVHIPKGGKTPLAVRSTCLPIHNRKLLLIRLRPMHCGDTGGLLGHCHMRAVLETTAIGIASCTLSGRILESNRALIQMLGSGVDSLTALHARGCDPSNARDETLLQELLDGRRDSYELDQRFRRADDSTLWGHLRVSQVPDGDGRPQFVTAMLEDITRRKRAEDQLREAEKLEVIGRLAGSIAHDFNNLLTGVLLYCDLLRSGLDDQNSLRSYVDEIRMAGEQGAALTQQLLAIARKQVLKPRPIVLNEVVTSTQNLLRRLIGEQIELVITLAPDLRMIVADPAQVRQILMNLVLNARDAIPENGTITISTDAKLLPGSSEPAVCLAVADTGCGMNAETRARLFEPFFTTKAQGHGTGLGLATVQRIVTENGGAIVVESEPGRGTKIEVFLPVTKPILAVPASEGDSTC